MRGVAVTAVGTNDVWGNVLRCDRFDPDALGNCRTCSFEQQLHKASAIYDEHREDRLAWHGFLTCVQRFPTSSDIGVLFGMVDLGWSVYERRVSPDTPVRGGIVIGIEVEDVEGLLHRTYSVVEFHYGRARFDRLGADEVDPETVQIPNSAAIRSTARRLQELGARKRGSVDGQELRVAQTVTLLLELVG